MSLIWLVLSCRCTPQDLIDPIEATSPVEVDVSVVPGELIVAVKPGTQERVVKTLFTDLGATILANLPGMSAYLLGVEEAERVQIRSSLAASVLVEDVIDNQIYELQKIPNDPEYANQWHLAAIGAPDAWSITTGDENVLVAVLDSGVDNTHSDLSAKLVPGVNVYENSLDTQDLIGHGTAVVGVIAAVADNQQGVASIAWANPILPIRATSELGRTTSWILAAGIREAINAGARVINISFAPLHDDKFVLAQARQARLAGALVVISAGNSGQEVPGDPALNTDYAVFVGAVDSADQLARFSTYGNFIDLTAPGVSILTTKPGDKYANSSGTSFAAPIVSGVAALIWSINPNLRPVTVEEILFSTAKDLGLPGYDSSYGHGRVDAGAAVQLACNIVEVEDVTAPSVAIATPANGSTISNDTTVEVRATDDFDVAEVTLSIDGSPLANDAMYPYLFVLTPSIYASGLHELTAVASDTSGNFSEHKITLRFGGLTDSIPPGVTISSPKNSDTVRGLVTIVANAWDNIGLERAEILLDNEVIETIPLFSETEAKIAYNWNTQAAEVTAGQHGLTLRVFDAAENQASATGQIIVKK